MYLEAAEGVIKVAHHLCMIYEFCTDETRANIKKAFDALKPLIFDDKIVEMLDDQFQEALDGKGQAEIDEWMRQYKEKRQNKEKRAIE